MHRILGLLSLMVAAVSFMPAAQAQDMYGAIAYSPSSGAHGYAYDYASQAGAEDRALDECRSYGEGCQNVMWFRNACGALAVGPDGWGSDWGEDRSRAENKAINACQQHSSNCQVIRWVCTSR